MCIPKKTNYTASKVFVTGADGMLGSMICRKLLETGYSVTAACHPNSTSKTISGLDVRIAKGDILDPEFLDKGISGHEYVVHVAALVKVWPRRHDIVRKVNIIGSRNVRQACIRHGVRRLIHIGSASSFTEGSKEKPGDEQSPFTANRFGLDYIDSKYVAQREMIKAYVDEKFPVVIINPTFMIGPFDSGPSSGRLLIKFYHRKLKAYSAGGRNFVFSGDVAQAVVNALHNGRPGECYITGHENLEYREFFQKACTVLGRSLQMRRVPQFIITAAGGVNSAIASITGKPPALSYSVAAMASVGHYFDAAKAVQELKMPQTPVEEAIEASIKWFRDNNYV